MAVAVVVGAYARTRYLVVHVTGRSMEPTLHDGQRVVLTPRPVGVLVPRTPVPPTPPDARAA